MDNAQYSPMQGISIVESSSARIWDDSYSQAQVDEASSHFQPEYSLETQLTKTEAGSPENNLIKHLYPQSALHNCPKHLIGFVSQALELKQLSDLSNNPVVQNSPEQFREPITGLLRLIILSCRGSIRSMSRELLKIIFESGAEEMRKLRLLDHPDVKEVFAHAAPTLMTQAKSILRSRTIEYLQVKKKKMLEISRICNKAVNQRYLQLFIRELREDRIRERITKREKLQILGVETEAKKL